MFLILYQKYNMAISHPVTLNQKHNIFAENHGFPQPMTESDFKMTGILRLN